MVQQKEQKLFSLKLCRYCGKAFMTEHEEKTTCSNKCEHNYARDYLKK